MKILHTADIHLGYTAYGKVNPDTGLNIRMQDVFEALNFMVETAIAEKVDAVMISGDLFHNLRPTNKTLAFCIGQLFDMQEHGITVFISGGNHDTPKSIRVTSPLEVLDFLSDITCTFENYETYELDITKFHMLPYVSDRERMTEILQRAIDSVDPSKVNILMMHAAYGKLRMMQYDELIIDNDEMSELRRHFDYIALGHYHGKFIERKDGVKGIVAYSGSLERHSFNEKNDDKGFFILDIDDDKNISTRHIITPAREMLDLPDIDLSDTSNPTDDIIAGVRERNGRLTDCICRVKIVGIPAMMYRALDFRRLRKETEHAMNFEFVFDIQEETLDFEVEHTSFKSMLDEWTDFTKERNIDEDIIGLGSGYIRDVED